MNQKFLAEFFGTAFLVMIVFGSGIMGEQLSQGNAAVALLVNSIATGAGLFVLIQTLGSISGAHFNPIVSFAELLWGRIHKKVFGLYLMAQFSGAVIGVFLTHTMFGLDILQLSSKSRYGTNLWISEVIASFGLISVIKLAGRKHVEFAPLTVAAYITSAYWFTSSTSFANPAVTVARIMTNTFCGISPEGALPFIISQVIGALLAFFLLKDSNKMI